VRDDAVGACRGRNARERRIPEDAIPDLIGDVAGEADDSRELRTRVIQRDVAAVENDVLDVGSVHARYAQKVRLNRSQLNDHRSACADENQRIAAAVGGQHVDLVRRIRARLQMQRQVGGAGVVDEGLDISNRRPARAGRGGGDGADDAVGEDGLVERHGKAFRERGCPREDILEIG
jgi:hypothetical protein